MRVATVPTRFQRVVAEPAHLSNPSISLEIASSEGHATVHNLDIGKQTTTLHSLNLIINATRKLE